MRWLREEKTEKKVGTRYLIGFILQRIYFTMVNFTNNLLLSIDVLSRGLKEKSQGSLRVELTQSLDNLHISKDFKALCAPCLRK